MAKQRYCNDCSACDRVYDASNQVSTYTCGLSREVITKLEEQNEIHKIEMPDWCPITNRSPKEVLKDNYKIKNVKLTKENKDLKKQINKLKKKLRLINDMSSSKS